MNLLCIMSDEHNRDILGCSGNALVRTPHLDALAARGTRFAHAYCASPICVPSRASFATGRYAHAIGSWDNAAPYRGEPASWMQRLRDAGVRTLSIGKLHFRNAQDDVGFDEQRIPMHVIGGVGDLRGNLLRDPQPVRRKAREKITAAGAGETEYTRYDRAIAAETVRFLREEAPHERRPWALFTSFTAPHFPLVAPQEYIGRYRLEDVPLPRAYALDERPKHPVLEAMRAAMGTADAFDDGTVRRAVRAYYALCSFLDDLAGACLRALDDAGLANDTLVVYVSDHGDTLGEHGMWWKSTMYEGAVAVPFIVAGPGVARGRVETSCVSLIDAFPTFVKAFGIAPHGADADLPGRSLWPSLGGEAGLAHRNVFSEYHAMGAITGAFMLRTATHKYIEYAGYAPQLFDLRAGPYEQHDLAGDRAAAHILAHARAELRAIADPDGLDRAARHDQARRAALAGGEAALRAMADDFVYSPPPAAMA